MYECDIETSPIHFQELYEGYGKKKRVKRFDISGRKNLVKFRENIGFSDKNKRATLEKALSNYKDIHKTKNRGRTVISKGRGYKTTEVAKELGISENVSYFHLYNLREEGQITNTKLGNKNIWFQKAGKFCGVT